MYTLHGTTSTNIKSQTYCPLFTSISICREGYGALGMIGVCLCLSTVLYTFQYAKIFGKYCKIKCYLYLFFTFVELHFEF